MVDCACEISPNRSVLCTVGVCRSDSPVGSGVSGSEVTLWGVVSVASAECDLVSVVLSCGVTV